jgi:glycerate kinase
MKANRYVHVEKPEHGIIVVRKTCGDLTVEEVCEAIRDGWRDDIFALFLKAPEFDGYVGEGKRKSVVLHNVSTMDVCPVCCKAREEIYNQIYEAAYVPKPARH